MKGNPSNDTLPEQTGIDIAWLKSLFQFVGLIKTNAVAFCKHVTSTAKFHGNLHARTHTISSTE